MAKPNFESRLISIVRLNKELYDPNVFKEKTQINQIWKGIAAALNTDENYCRTRWKSLRNHYRKIMIQIQDTGGIENYTRKWKYFNEMSFIDPFLLSTDKLIISVDKSHDQQTDKERFDDRLLDLVRQYEFIYNKDHKLFHQKSQTRQAWAEIAEKLKSDPRTCQIHWLKKRSCYQKTKRKINEKGGITKYKPTWRLFPKMSFVDPWDSTQLLPENEYSIIENNECSNSLLSEEEIYYEISEQNAELLSDASISEENTSSETNSCRKTQYIVHHNTTSESEIDSLDIEKNKSHIKVNSRKTKSERVMTNPTSDSSCSTYFSMLGMKIDEVAVPLKIRYNLERQITHLVYDVLKTYCEAASDD